VAAGMPVVGLTTRNPEHLLMEAKPTLIIKDYEDPNLWTALEELDKQEAAVKPAAWIISLVTRRIMIYLNNSFPRELMYLHLEAACGLISSAWAHNRRYQFGSRGCGITLHLTKTWVCNIIKILEQSLKKNAIVIH